ncbi:MAG TPA: hypothetical protein VK140_13680 [Ktedonobacteraceae bacterium]|nr:hypothetical protein [Ktedonobacteraceae bacterium]
MISQSTGHGWSQQHFSRRALSSGCPAAQLVVWPTEVVGASKQVHACFQSLQTMGRVTTFPGQAREPLTHRPIQPFDKSRIEHASSLGLREQLLGLFQRSLSHPPNDFDDPFFRRSLDDCGNENIGPHLQTGPSSPSGRFDFLSKRPSDTVGVR